MTPTLVLLHGFLGGPWSYDRVIPKIDGNRRILTPTLAYHAAAMGVPDHADAFQAEVGVHDHADAFQAEVERLAAKVRVTCPEPVDLVGYSLGGRLALAIAIAHPSHIRRLILLSARRGLDSVAERLERQAHDESWARLLETQGLEVFLDRWWQQPIFRGLSQVAPDILDAERARRGQHTPDALACALRNFGLGHQPSYALEVRQLSIPTVLVAGGLDEKFLALSRQLADQLPNGHCAVVEQVGHQLLVEAPDQVARIINEETTR